MTDKPAVTAPATRKISVRIWTPLLEKFSQRMDSACLRRDAWLTKLLEREIDELDSEITTPNSEAARQFIVARLDALPRKLVTLTLPEELIRKLDQICERKHIARDAFFSRLFFLLVADFKVQTRLFFNDDDSWFERLLEGTDVSSSAAGDLLDPIPDFRDPFLTIREGQAVLREDLIKEFGTAERADEWLRDRRIYTAPITEKTFPKVDLSGLNVYLPDWRVPGATSHYGTPVDLSEFLDDSTGPQPDIDILKEPVP